MSRAGSKNSRCHLDSRIKIHALSRIPSYPRQLTYAHTLQATGQDKNLPFTAPSAGHLMICFQPGFHLAQALCVSIITFTSASSVFAIYLIANSIARIFVVVNSIFTDNWEMKYGKTGGYRKRSRSVDTMGSN